MDGATATGTDYDRVNKGGIPLAATLTGGNRNDITRPIPLLQAVPAVRGKRGRPGAARAWCWCTALRGALPLCEEVVRPQRTKKARSYALLATPNL